MQTTDPHWLTGEEQDALGENTYVSENNSDPLACYNGKWYFCDETWANMYGPFETKDECAAEVIKYARCL